MAYYAIFNYDVTSPGGYGDYQKAAGPTLAGRNFKVLALDSDTAHVEGAVAGKQTVLMEFEDKAAFEDWYHSGAYKEAAKLRFAATTPQLGIGVQGLG